MITTALALHLWHMVAEGGKLAPSPVTAIDSFGCSSGAAGAGAAFAAAGLTSLFFF